jgi:hypothetical protein
VYTEEFEVKTEAIKRETKLKSAKGRALFGLLSKRTLTAQMVSAQDSYPPMGGRQFDPAPRYRAKSHLRVAFCFAAFVAYNFNCSDR